MLPSIAPLCKRRRYRPTISKRWGLRFATFSRESRRNTQHRRWVAIVPVEKLSAAITLVSLDSPLGWSGRAPAPTAGEAGRQRGSDRSLLPNLLWFTVKFDDPDLAREPRP